MISCWIVALLPFSSVCAQRNFRPGYIITLKQDTVYGQIDFRTDRVNAERCMFKLENTEAVTYLPYQILGYCFTDDGKYYVSQMIKTDVKAEEIPVFLECLLVGIKSLYYYVDQDHRNLYFIQDGERLEMLDAPELDKMKNEGLTVNGRTDRYMSTLQQVFRDCPGLAPEILKTPFSHKGLIAITKEYYRAVCKPNEDCIEFENRASERKGVQILFTPYVGVVQYSLFGHLDVLKPDLSYMAGISIAIMNKRWRGIFSGVLDFSLSRLDMIPSYDISYTKYTATSFSLKTGVSLMYPKGKIRPFLEGGADFFKRMKSDEFKDLYPGGYIGVGVNVKLARNERQSLVIRARFERVRDTLGDKRYEIEPGPFLNGWSAVVGYTF